MRRYSLYEHLLPKYGIPRDVKRGMAVHISKSVLPLWIGIADNAILIEVVSQSDDEVGGDVVSVLSHLRSDQSLIRVGHPPVSDEEEVYRLIHVQDGEFAFSGLVSLSTDPFERSKVK